MWKSRNLRRENNRFALESQSCVTGAQFCLGPFLCCLYDGAEATETTATDDDDRRSSSSVHRVPASFRSFVRSLVRGWISYLRRARLRLRSSWFPGMTVGGDGAVQCTHSRVTARSPMEDARPYTWDRQGAGRGQDESLYDLHSTGQPVSTFENVVSWHS